MNLNEFLEKVRNTDLVNTIKRESVEKLDQIGIPKARIPVFEEPRYPEDITSIDLRSLGKLYGEFMAWSAYCKYLLKLKEADVLLAKNMVSQARKWAAREHGVTLSSRKGKEVIDSDETVLQLEAAQTEFEVQKTTLEARLDWFDECSKALSREISRRHMEYDRSGDGFRVD